jgi:hypothetical protein
VKVLICGGRDFDLKDEMFAFLDLINKDLQFTTVIEGDARGADKLAGEWAQARDIPVEKYPADWENHGKAAGFIRNKQMLDEGTPELVIAFPGGNGTANMVKQAREAGVKVVELG